MTDPVIQRAWLDPSPRPLAPSACSLAAHSFTADRMHRFDSKVARLAECVQQTVQPHLPSPRATIEWPPSNGGRAGGGQLARGRGAATLPSCSSLRRGGRRGSESRAVPPLKLLACHVSRPRFAAHSPTWQCVAAMRARTAGGTRAALAAFFARSSARPFAQRSTRERRAPLLSSRAPISFSEVWAGIQITTSSTLPSASSKQFVSMRQTRASGREAAVAHRDPLRTALAHTKLSVIKVEPGHATKAACTRAHDSAPLMESIQSGTSPLAEATTAPELSTATKAQARRAGSRWL
jgi:hypothetical protein